MNVTHDAQIFLVIDISAGANAKQYPVQFLEKMPEPGWDIEYKTNKIVLRRIHSGVFQMSYNPCGFVNHLGDSYPHDVKLTKDYYVGIFPVTQQQWSLVMGKRSQPSQSNGQQSECRPVDSVSYHDIRGAGAGSDWPASAKVSGGSFIGRLRAKTGIAELDIPTEAEWEYACRSEGMKYWIGEQEFNLQQDAGDNILEDGEEGSSFVSELDKVAWFRKNQDKEAGITGSHPVGGKKPNAIGLYDMLGNIYEWCLDWYRDIDSFHKHPVDPVGNCCECAGGGRVIRGGAWSSPGEDCISIMRNHRAPDCRDERIGFRLCCHADSIDLSTLQVKGSCTGAVLKWCIWLVFGFVVLKLLGIL